MDIHLLHADVGPVRPADYARNKRRPWPESTTAAVEGTTVARNLPAEEAERVLRRVEQKLYCTHSHSPDDRDRGLAAIHAASCSGGTSNVGPIV
jgi:hypothetical protein